jgi:hypothetical protein
MNYLEIQKKNNDSYALVDLFKAKIISISNGVDCCTPGISGLDYIS